MSPCISSEMNFEELAVEWFRFNFNDQRRKYEYEPIYMEVRKGYIVEDFAEEKIRRKEEKKLQRKQRRQRKVK